MPTLLSPDPATHVPLMDRLRAWPPERRERYLGSLSRDEMEAFLYDWFGVHARAAQVPPRGDWNIWLILAGRGFGKTRTGAETTRWVAESGQVERIGLVARTGPDARGVMVEGPSGILRTAHPSFRPHWEPSKRQLTWPNGVIATTFSADQPEQLRGPEHGFIWGDEPASWPLEVDVGELDAFENLLFGLRAGLQPWGILTGTPKASGMMRKILAHPNLALTGGKTTENRANLAPTFLRYILDKYAGTRLGLQELDAVVLLENPDALWNLRTMIAPFRRPAPDTNRLRRIVIGVDPEAASTEDSAETGIIAVGRGFDNHGYVLGDMTIHGTPRRWGKAVVAAYHDFKADRVIAEVNNGGEMVMHVIHTIDPRVPVRMVRATRGKLLRAEPVSALYEQGRAHHCGEFPDVETEMTQWVPGQKSPDRLDALVWAFTALFAGRGTGGRGVVGPVPPGRLPPPHRAIVVPGGGNW